MAEVEPCWRGVELTQSLGTKCDKGTERNICQFNGEK